MLPTALFNCLTQFQAFDPSRFDSWSTASEVSLVHISVLVQSSSGSQRNKSISIRARCNPYDKHVSVLLVSEVSFQRGRAPLSTSMAQFIRGLPKTQTASIFTQGGYWESFFIHTTSDKVALRGKAKWCSITLALRYENIFKLPGFVSVEAQYCYLYDIIVPLQVGQ